MARFDLPAVTAVPVRVELENQSSTAVEALVTMRVAGERVHYSRRRVAGGSESLLIGPDRADSVLVEATLLSEPPVSLPMHTFFLGQDFQSGDTLHVLLAEAEPEEPGQQERPPPPAPDLSVAIGGLDDDVRANAGTEVSFDVLSAGASSAAVLAVFADPNQLPGDGDELVVADELPAAAQLGVVWDTTGVSPGTYGVYAELRDGERFARSAFAPGRVRINAQPALAFDSPVDGLLVMQGRALIIAWAAQDDDDDATITIFLDRDDVYAGDEQVLRDGISEDDVSDRELVADTSGLELGTYFVGGLISDGLTDNVVYAGQVCVTFRWAGRFVAGDADFGPGEMTTVSGAADNVALGMDVDAGRDLDGDGKADLLLADPLARGEYSRQAELGEVYYHESGTWPRHLDTSQLTLRIVGEQEEAGAGARVALLPPVDADSQGDILIGAPYFDALEPRPQADVGRAYVLNGTEVDELGTLFLAQLGETLGGSITGPADQPAAFGLDVAALGDINGDGVADYAVAASQFDAFGSEPLPQSTDVGVVALLAGGQLPDAVDFSQIGCGFAGALASGVAEGGLAGYAVHGVGDLDGDTVAEFAIGAPGGYQGSGVPGGVVYLVYGPVELADDCYNAGDFYLDQVGAPEGIRGHVFVGEQAGDGAGTALASGDFDGDGAADLLIGAPGHDDGRGRVYLIYNVDALPEGEGPWPLGEVGRTIAGAIFDGVAPGDQTGWSLSTAGDVDLDGAQDILIGAPGTESLRGAALLVYGGQHLSGTLSLATLATCGLPGMQLVGEQAGSRLGFSVSGGGDLTGNNVPDLAIGAPGNGTVLGRAFVLFGRWPYGQHDDPDGTDGGGPFGSLDQRPLPPP